ncbi:hypothetical protein B6U81_01040 [Thermoplasmatales archaeon ex4484_30]|nr:MAG: hypothetical protein B6U81_01040 [Thermoplasmatales archaeon ex4484_30]
MKWGKKLGSVFVVMLLIAIPFMTKADYEGKKVPVHVKIMNPRGVTEKFVEISEKEAIDIEENLGKMQQALKTIFSNTSSDEDKNGAIEMLQEFINKLVGIGILSPSFATRFIINLLSPKFDLILPVISFGRGFSIIPLYPGEAFIGFMFRPIIMQYFLLGYTASLNLNFLPPRIEYWDMVGTHTLVILGFVGVYIDLGKIGYGIPRVQFAMGEALFAGGLDWF